MAQGLGGYAQTKILRDVHGMPIPGYSRKNTFVGNMSEHETQGLPKTEIYIEEIPGPFPPSSIVLAVQVHRRSSDPGARTTGETCNRGVGSTVSPRLL
jgi:hypothetical protein